MTDRHSGYLVTLAEDIREDDAEYIITALRMIQGVLSVQPVTHDHAVAIAEQRAAGEWQEMLWRIARHVRTSKPSTVLAEEKS